MSTITGIQVHAPEVIEGAEQSSPARTIVHDTLGGVPVVTLRAAGPARGRATAVFAAELPARALETDLRNARTFTMVRDDVDAGPVTFVPQGETRVEVDTDTYAWLVTFEYVVVA